MAESVYKVIELIGTSKDSWEKAAAAAVSRAGKSLRDLRVAEVVKLDLQLDAKGEVEAYRAKVKTPLEFVASAVRATGATIASAQPLVAAMQNLGMPLFGCQPPTGYATTADAWINTGALLNRMNFAVQLVSGGRLATDLRALAPDTSHATQDALVDRLLDPLVARCRLDIPGLVYLPQSDDPRSADVQIDFTDAAEQAGAAATCSTPLAPAAAFPVLARLARATRRDEVAAV